MLTEYVIISTDMSSFISDWLTEAGLNLLGEIKEGGKDLILKRLGLKEFFSGPKCSPLHKPYSPSVQGWNNGIYVFSLNQFKNRLLRFFNDDYKNFIHWRCKMTHLHTCI